MSTAVQTRAHHWFPHPATMLLGVATFAIGMCGLVAEYILSTVSTYILGNSIEQWSITIALMMLMMGVAGYLQKFVSDRHLLEKFVVVEVLMTWLAAYAPIAMYAAFGSMTHHFAVVQYFFVMSIGALIGFEIPLVLRINERYTQTLKTNVASIICADYIGAFCGALVWVYVLLPWLPLTEISFLLAGVNFLMAVLASVYFIRQRLLRAVWSITILLTITAVGLMYGYWQNRAWNLSLEQKLYDSPIVFAQTTRYQRLVMTHNRKLDDIRLYINGNLQFSSLDEAIYHEHLVHPVMSLVPDHRHVLILGGGDGLALREVLKYQDVETITLVDLDPDMTRLGATNPLLTALNKHAFADARVVAEVPAAVREEGFTTIYQATDELDERQQSRTERIADVSILNIDADKFFDTFRSFYNVIIVDLPDPSSVELCKLYSKEFYLKMRNVLAENGMVVIQATSPYHAKEAFLCVRRTLEAAEFTTLPLHDNVPSFGDWGFILGWKARHSEAEVQVSLIRRDLLRVKTRYLTPDVISRASVFGKDWLISHRSDINTLMNPVLLQIYMKDSWQVE